MIRIRLINEGRVVKQITSRLHEGVVLEQVKNYKDPFDTVQIVEGDLSEDAKSMLQHVARRIIPAAMAAGVAMSGAGPAQAQGGANPNYPGLNHSVGQHMADIFSPNYKEAQRQREYNRSTERQVWDAEQNEIRKQRMADARTRAGGGSVQKHVIYDQSRLSKDGKSYIIYGIDNTVRRVPVSGTEYMAGDGQRLPHYITSGGNVLYVRHPHAVTEGAELKQAKRKYNQAAKDANADQAGAGKKFDTMKKSMRQKDVDNKKEVAEGYTVTRGIDRERYQERAGLEGPFSTKSGKVVYYDPKEGKYYDPETDFYIGHEDYAKMDEAAPALVRGAAGLALGGIAAAGTPALMGILGPVLGIGVGAYGAYNASKFAMARADEFWDWAAKKLGGSDNAEEFAMTHINAAMKGQPTFEYNGKTYEVKATPQQAKAAGLELSKVAEDATVGTIPASGTVGTSGGTGRTQFAPTGKTTNAKFNKNGQIELDTEQEDDGSVNLDADAVKQLQQAGVQIKEDEHSPVASAITRRIMSQRVDLLQQYGPVLVMQAIDEVADFVGDVEEIGSSDVSGWVKQVEQMLQENPSEAFGEAVNEGTDTLEGILSKYSADYAKFKAGGDIDENQDFFDALYNHYSDTGEMPYEIAKGRNGDPYEWITQRLDNESGVSPVAEAEENLATAGDQAAADQNIIMKIRKASDYEKPTRIELADGTESVIAPNIAKQILAKFDKMKPESKALLQDTLNTEEGFKEILAYFGGGVREQAADRAGNIMQAAMAEAGFGRRDAYQRDYDSSVAGMGKRQSYAYQQDGGANDEGWDREEYQAPQDTYYIRFKDTGLVYKQKGVPKAFSNKAGANGYALAMIKNNPALKGNLLLSVSSEDKAV